jgi:signal transduction histidine kinase
MPEGGRLNIKTGVKGDFAEITLKDTGEGIPKENLKKIFDPLFTTKAKGIGLGLAIVRSIIDGHEGTIEVESPSTDLRTGEVGKGTSFIVKLPVG